VHNTTQVCPVVACLSWCQVPNLPVMASTLTMVLSMRCFSGKIDWTPAETTDRDVVSRGSRVIGK
jgi:hypothetical protein